MSISSLKSWQNWQTANLAVALCKSRPKFWAAICSEQWEKSVRSVCVCVLKHSQMSATCQAEPGSLGSQRSDQAVTVDLCMNYQMAAKLLPRFWIFRTVEVICLAKRLHGDAASKNMQWSTASLLALTLWYHRFICYTCSKYWDILSQTMLSIQ